MSSDLAVQIQHANKCYTIYDRPEDRLKQSIVPRFEKLIGRPQTQFYREFWALRDISFSIKKGETVGIIGRNGSGKSTLLQMICGTLVPTSGIVETRGRIAALLELGSGFNPEFTGRENVHMNAAILGLSPEEIIARFDTIVAFADIGNFLDQPVKTYSSGMTLRLAFAVIANVDADILVIDEALAVGDAFFTQKCMRFLRKFMEQGTVIFVSHDTGAVINLCERAIWLDKGRLAQDGSSKDTSEAYLRAGLESSYGGDVKLKPLAPVGIKPVAVNPADKVVVKADSVDDGMQLQIRDNLDQSSGWNTGLAEIESVQLLDQSGAAPTMFSGSEHITLLVRARAHSDMISPIIGFLFKDRLGQLLFGENTFEHVKPSLSLKSGQSCEARFAFQLPYLPDGEYTMAVSIAEGTVWDHIQHNWLHEALLIKVVSGKIRYGLIGLPYDFVTMTVV
jgi:lipopolysaccharide transport system ATP-binding protein